MFLLVLFCFLFFFSFFRPSPFFFFPSFLFFFSQRPSSAPSALDMVRPWFVNLVSCLQRWSIRFDPIHSASAMTETNSIEADEGKLQAMLRTLVNQLITPELYLLIPTILPCIRRDTVPYPRQTIGHPDIVRVQSAKTAEQRVLSDCPRWRYC